MTGSRIEDRRLREWFGLTEQQMRILFAIHALELEGAEVCPGDILSKYSATYRQEIRRQNLFTQMKPLLDRDLVVRSDRGRYEVNLQAIQKTLDLRKKSLANESSSIDAFASVLEKQMRETALKKKQPHAMYLNEEEYLNKVGEHIKRADRIYIISASFPNIAYSEDIIGKLGRGTFYDALMGCLEEEKRLYYMTSLFVELPYRRILEIYKNQKRAVQETIRMIDRLRDYARRHDNFTVGYRPHLVGTPQFILEGRFQGEMYLSLKGGDVELEKVGKIAKYRSVYPGVYINSVDVAQRAKENYLSLFNESIPLKSEAGDAILNSLKEKVRGHWDCSTHP